MCWKIVMVELKWNYSKPTSKICFLSTLLGRRSNQGVKSWYSQQKEVAYFTDLKGVKVCN